MDFAELAVEVGFRIRILDYAKVVNPVLRFECQR